jgi:hypothetical protein
LRLIEALFFVFLLACTIPHETYYSLVAASVCGDHSPQRNTGYSASTITSRDIYCGVVAASKHSSQCRGTLLTVCQQPNPNSAYGNTVSV